MIKGIMGVITGDIIPENSAIKLGKKANQRAFFKPRKKVARKRTALTSGPDIACIPIRGERKDKKKRPISKVISLVITFLSDIVFVFIIVWLIGYFYFAFCFSFIRCMAKFFF